jgi:hypothetical protein
MVTRHVTKHNISKNQLTNTSSFDSTTNLGKMDFNFSCKIYHTKVYTAFTKVVGFVTRSTRKLVSHFSDFLCIYMHFTIVGKTHKT